MVKTRLQNPYDGRTKPITTFISSGRLRWYGHVMRKMMEDCVKKCMEIRVELYKEEHWLEDQGHG